jgi:hypothetical protein
MKDGRFEKEDLDEMDYHRILLSLLLYKEVFTLEEFNQARDEMVEEKNKALEKELEESPGAKFLWEMMNGMVGKKDDE